MPIRLTGLFALLICFASCDNNYLYQEEKTLPGAVWTYRDTLDFSFTVADTSTLYNLYLDFKHSDAFPYQNIYLKLYTRFPDGKRLSKVRNFDLFDAQGTSNGQCSGGECSVRILLQDNAFFNTAGAYTITLEQYMRVDSLNGIIAAGLAVEKTGKTKADVLQKK